jgi:hypothetical protein
MFSTHVYLPAETRRQMVDLLNQQLAIDKHLWFLEAHIQD